MRRFKWIGFLAWMLAVLSTRLAAQQLPGPAIGFLSGGSPYEWAPFVAAFRQGLADLGYFEGRNTSIQFRWALGNAEPTPLLAGDLAARGVAVIVSSGGLSAFHASVNAKPTIPVVAMFGDDPASNKLAAGIDGSDTHVTGVSLQAQDLDLRRLTILQSIIRVSTVGLIVNGKIAPAAGLRERFESAAHQLGLRSVVVLTRTDEEIDNAFLMLFQQHVDAIAIASSAYFLDNRDRFAALALRYKLPVIYPARAYVEAGGFLSYGTDRLDAYRQLGHYTGRILQGQVPNDLPVLRPTKFELVVNAKAAKAIGLTVPQSLLARADAVVQ